MASVGAGNGIQHGYSNWSAVALEVVASAFLMFTYMGTAVDKQAPINSRSQICANKACVAHYF